MAFTSIQFLAFLSLVVLLFYAMRQRFRTAFLLVASYCFYASFNPAYVVLLIVSTIVAWGTGVWIGSADRQRPKKAGLVVGIAVSLAPLVFFKYFYFVNESMRALFDRTSLVYPVPDLKVLLPVGISFFTFRIVSYLVDVYRAACPPEKRIFTLALHIAFFPQLLAGPIDRAPNLLPQFDRHIAFSCERMVSGLQLMLWGFFKKLIIADRCAILVNQVYGNPGSYAGYPLVLATYLFAFQIYCDFSGYTDMARGASRILGFESMVNFNRPYFARSISEFWRRWHISLSTWFRDYVYIPLGGSRVAVPRYYGNLLVVFVVSGLWHGAGWTFIAWGAVHGLYMICSSFFAPLRKKITGHMRLDRFPVLKNAIGILATFHLVLAGWVFFRAHSFSDAWYVLTHAFGPVLLPVTEVPLGLPMSQIALAAIAILFMLIVEVIQETGRVRLLWARQPRAIRWAVYAAIVLACINLQAPVKSAFIYLQF
jgi:alginate O-acetyltransferase complex protein AlgI